MEYLSILSRSPLFQGIDEKELPIMLNCLSTREQTFKKGEYVLRRGEHINAMGMVIRGSVHIFKDDFWGTRVIIGEASVGNLFGETYACIHAEALEVNVVAAEETTVLFLNIKRVLTVCSSACTFHTRLIRNLLSVLAEKNLMLTRKMDHMGKRTTREKLLSYLSAQSLKTGSPAFEIPFNRQQLADYLCVDRSAMSNELSKMREEGILSFDKNRFRLEPGQIGKDVH